MSTATYHNHKNSVQCITTQSNFISINIYMHITSVNSHTHYVTLSNDSTSSLCTHGSVLHSWYFLHSWFCTHGFCTHGRRSENQSATKFCLPGIWRIYLITFATIDCSNHTKLAWSGKYKNTFFENAIKIQLRIAGRIASICISTTALKIIITVFLCKLWQQNPNNTTLN